MLGIAAMILEMLRQKQVSEVASIAAARYRLTCNSDFI
jgi:hypothetical protein